MSDPIEALTLGLGTDLLCVTSFPIMLYLSVKFHSICFRSF